MVCIQLLSCGNTNYLWCFCYQYTTLIISCLIKRRLGIVPIIVWYICYTILFAELVVWGCKIYIINYDQVKNALDPHTNTYLFACPPSISPSLISLSAYGLFVEYSNSTKFVIYFEPKNRRNNGTLHYYIGEYDVKLQPDESMSIGEFVI